ncbi:hypothetical protein DYB32_004865 [Aphanomyces invadans]|uniref:PH domain-containing protein n=1 Tax=Aphanomyces invadans TaxID=157072 RepID=A0A3R7D0L2_9STRA|nr:hypothetical protein DYB32_004865 [Aphanomyces invadans]
MATQVSPLQPPYTRTTTIKTVARLPKDLLVAADSSTLHSKRLHHCDYMWKRGRVNQAMKRRYMDLQDSKLSYFKALSDGNQYPRGVVNLTEVSLVRPNADLTQLELVTSKRTWVLQPELDFEAWARAICESVPYNVVHVALVRLLQLTEVDSSSKNKVRLVILPTDTVDDVVGHVFESHLAKLDSVPLASPYNPSDYFLQVTGFHDYMVHRTTPMDRYVHVQECMATKATLFLTLLHRDRIAATIYHPNRPMIAPLKDYATPQQEQDLSHGTVAPQHVGSLELDRSLDRSGWLIHQHASSSWTKKWCQLTYSTGTMVMAAINKSHGPMLHEALPLSGANVTALANAPHPGQQAWVFQLAFPGNSTGILLGTRTRYERDAWVKTIQLVVAAASPVERDAAKSNVPTVADLGEFHYVVHLIRESPLFQLCGFEKTALWHHRREFLDSFEALPRLLSSVNWRDPQQARDMVELLPEWTKPSHPALYIALLECGDSRVRQFVVDQLATLSDNTFRLILPQLVQAVKSDAQEMSPLSALLIERAVKAPTTLGVDLYWALKVETDLPQHRERFGLLLNAYIGICTDNIRSTLELQDAMFGLGGRVEAVCREIQRVQKLGASDKDVSALLHAQLTNVNKSLQPCLLPVDSRVKVGQLVVANCRVMRSTHVALWLEFENAEIGHPSVCVIFKYGNDVRQEALALQLMRVMDVIWKEEGMHLGVEPCQCVATGSSMGLIQVVPQAISFAVIQRQVGGLRGLLGRVDFDRVLLWIHESNPKPLKLATMKDLFLRSCAGHCVAVHVLGFQNTTCDNIFVTLSARCYLVDVGTLLRRCTITQELQPVGLTTQVSHVVEDGNGRELDEFIKTGVEAFNSIRRHLHLLLSLLQLMIPLQLPNLKNQDDLMYIVEAIAPEKTSKDAALMFEDLITRTPTIGRLGPFKLVLDEIKRRWGQL